MRVKSEVETFLSQEVESATARHLAAKRDLQSLRNSLNRERRAIDENDPEMRVKERMLRNARLALLLALQRYNSFVSRGIVPEKPYGLTNPAPTGTFAYRSLVSELYNHRRWQVN